tara:strand:- start:4921 stop:5430 length:510 start_codon:yes stop_codon:yes gene_type:complete
MAKPLISEILQGLTEVEGKELHKARVAYLQKHNRFPALMAVLRINFDEAVVSDLPKGDPPYRKDDAPAGMEYITLHRGFRRLKHFFNGNTDIVPARREKLFVDLLESLNGKEAEVLLLAKERNLYDEYKGLTLKVVQDAFPGLIVKAPEKKAPVKKKVAPKKSTKKSKK